MTYQGLQVRAEEMGITLCLKINGECDWLAWLVDAFRATWCR